MSKYNGEKVMVVQVSKLREIIPEVFKVEDCFIKSDDSNLKEIWEEGEFVDRDLAENDGTIKQIIPYVIVMFEDKILQYTRGKVGQEIRLHAKKSIGVGGHINPEDIRDIITNKNPFDITVIRELGEEISLEIDDIHSLKFLGFVNEDSQEVGSVHLGLVYVATLHKFSDLTNLEDCIVNPEFVTLPDLEKSEDLEGWSKLIVEVIKNN